MNEENAPIAFILLVALIAVVGFGSFSGGLNEGTERVQASAVEAGVGEYVVIDSNGNTEFKWITNEN